MNWKAWLPLGVAVVLGLVAMRMAMNVISAQPTEQQVHTSLTPIVVAAREIGPGTTLVETDLKLGKVDAADVPAGAFVTPQQLANRVTKISLSPGQPILPSLLADEGSGAGMGATLPEGMRAITVEIGEASGVAGLLEPSCRVDVVGTFTMDGRATARTILESIQVFALGARTGPAQPPQPGQAVEQPRTATLLVTPEQAEKLELASVSTRLRLVLRNGKDETRSTTDGVTLVDLRSSGTDPTTKPSVELVSHTLDIPVGMRAYTMDADRRDGIAFLQPNDRVDIISSRSANNEAKARTLLRNVTVLAIGNRVTNGLPNADGSNTVTVLVSPQDAEKLNRAASEGGLRIVLRNKSDLADASDEAIVEAPKGVDPFAAPLTPASDTTIIPQRRSWTIEIIRGGQSSSQTVDLPAAKEQAKRPVTPTADVTE